MVLTLLAGMLLANPSTGLTTWSAALSNAGGPGTPPHLWLQQTSAQRNAGDDNPILSDVESIRYLGTFINVLARLHRMQHQLDGLMEDDFVGRMTQLRLMATEADV